MFTMHESILFEIQQLLPDILLACLSLLLIFLEFIWPGIKKETLTGITAGGIFLCAGATANMAGNDGSYFSGMLAVDEFSLFFRFLFLLIALLTVLTSRQYWDNQKIHESEYYALLLIATIGMNFMVSSRELLMVFLGLETLSIASYILLGINKRDHKSNESSLKYFLLGSFSSAFLLYGIGFAYGASGTTTFHGITTASASIANQPMMILASILMIVGIGFKAAIVPFHLWTPDVYEGAPSPIAGFMSTAPKAAAFAVFLRLLFEMFPFPPIEWQEVFWVLALLTMTLGNLAAVAQTNVKRMLAYSSIAHAGYMLIPFAAGASSGASSILFYLLTYAFTNLGAFALVAFRAGNEEKKVYLEDYSGLAQKAPGISAALSICLLSLAGIPLTAGFAAKFFLFKNALESHLLWLVLVAVLNSAISVYYYSRVIVFMYMRPATMGNTEVVLRLSPFSKISLFIALTGILYLGIFPEVALVWARNSMFFLP
jgi:NADH-quinone oxidoreductase subunit N